MIPIINIYAPNTGAPQYIRQMLSAVKGEIDRNTITVADFNTPLYPMDRSSKMKINKETETLNDTTDQTDLVIQTAEVNDMIEVGDKVFTGTCI